MSVIEVDGLSRTLESPSGAVHALQDVSFRVEAGEFVALIGRSGSGKTTLLNCLGGLDRPTAGRVVVDGRDLTELDDDGRTDLRRDVLAFVFQTFGLVPVLSAAENVELPLRLRRVAVAERRDRVAELLELVGLADHARQRPGELSGGQQQRVAIARALAASPAVLLADEPTGQLDAETGAQILALLRDLSRSTGMTMLVSTHDPSVRDRADRVLELQDGRLLA
ncbi:ABC transporter ATP-binding protein [Amnibacterium kyonggiense]|uniref:Putative ABC transport system ATP-binding protein n=1 Tax=Amnibacterium kyonggiense TaxID=595671 RepID=A0A4R7FGQ7_9MICO|nr:ABC transporter ATP-binding protein [Amnibacterium kyonggiense]TDS75827.1 putative ABC transport system ATP-binding protein [Amnibacterium kyonggiense]